jgi:antibiotic biosynthesis monooxygenase (ABM) superfamily enzyme
LPRGKSVNPPEPPYYKQVIIGVITVYPVILLSNLLVAPFLQGLHPLLSLLISVTFISALLSYPVMPYATKILAFWLYPSSQKRSKKKRK